MWDLNSRPLSCELNALAAKPPSHPSTSSSADTVYIVRSWVDVSGRNNKIGVIGVFTKSVTRRQRSEITVDNVWHWSNCWDLDNAGWSIQQGRYVTVVGSTVRMTRKIIYQPVIHTVWNIKTCQLLKISHVTDRIKRFTEIKCNDNNVWVIVEKLSYSVK